MPHRDFDAARKERQRGADTVSFTLGGDRFACVLEPALGDAFALADAPEPEVNETSAVRAILAFTEALVVPEDRKRFRRMIRRQLPGRLRRRPRNPVSPGDVIELGVWLSQEYTGRPTEPSTDSSDGREPTGASSNAGTSNGSESTAASPTSG